jgi:hypothetical protein
MPRKSRNDGQRDQLKLAGTSQQKCLHRSLAFDLQEPPRFECKIATAHEGTRSGVIKVGKHKSRDGALQGSVIGARESLVEPGETPRVIE